MNLALTSVPSRFVYMSSGLAGKALAPEITKTQKREGIRQARATGGQANPPLIRERGLGELNLAELWHYFSCKPFQLFEADRLWNADR
jgi:hypothetical protein